MICKFCGAKKQKDKAFCEYCGARFPVQQPAIQSPSTYYRTQNAGSNFGGTETYTTTETFGRGTLTNPNQKVDKRAAAFVLFVLFAPFIVGIAIIMISIFWGAGNNTPSSDTPLTATATGSWYSTLDAQHNTYHVVLLDTNLKSTSKETIRTAVVHLDLFSGGVFYKTEYVVLYDIFPGETRNFNRTIRTFSEVRPTVINIARVACYSTLYHPARGEITDWNFTLITTPQTQASFTVGIRNHSSTTIERATLTIRLFSYGALVGEFTITINNIPAGQERKIELGTRVFTATGVIDETTAVVLKDIKFT